MISYQYLAADCGLLFLIQNWCLAFFDLTTGYYCIGYMCVSFQLKGEE